MDSTNISTAERVFAVPELLEHILTLYLLHQLLPLGYQEDPRSVRVHANAYHLQHLLRCTEVSRAWNHGIHGSNRLQRTLFLLADHGEGRSWDRPPQGERERRGLLGNYYTVPSLYPPQLNPIIQSILPMYHFRFWHLDLKRHCAYLIIRRRDVPAVHLRSLTGQGRSLSNMFLSQPPCTALKAMIWEERDETTEYIEETTVLRNSVIHCEGGVTLGMVHERVYRMFADHADVSAIKLTTL